MKWQGLSIVPVVGVLTVNLIGGSGCNGTPREEPAARVSSLTIFPVTAMGQQHKNFGEAVGLLLEKEGFTGTEIADAAFRPSGDQDFQQTAQSFGRFVAAIPIPIDYALYCEFQGSPRKVTGVREALIDSAGKVIWVDEQTPQDQAFKRVKPRDPMSCCVLVQQRLQPMLVRTPKEKGETLDKMEQMWTHHSGSANRPQWMLTPVFGHQHPGTSCSSYFSCFSVWPETGISYRA